ncbi:MAG: prolipoprotein diacylglyceryl transferase [Candidatus Chisholmbacteria bacterium]|nr:prolipoprotein diacylglyceryl transferase [Candidatus Chisholmbacteria bacterium]
MQFYGLMVTAGIVMGGIWAEKIRKRQNLKISVWDALVWVVIPGVIGARLYHVIDWWEYYRQNSLLIPAVWTGGLGIFGAIGGGVGGLWWFTKRYKQDFLSWLDLVGVGAPLGQAIGRWGNFFNQELYGRQTNLPWGIYIERENGYFHPLFLYESVWNLVVFGVVWWLLRFWGKLKTGSFFAIYLLGYSAGRLILESLRVGNWQVGGVAVAQAVSLILVVLSWIWLWKSNKWRLNFRLG